MDALHSTYRQLADAIGVDNMLAVYDLFKGLQVQFPMRLYDRDLAGKKIASEFTGHNARALSNKYGYSQRWIYKKVQNDKNNR
ncbi:Mor transcription activator family protein [Lacticaseibacillus absianus]|uniref:Mor transcription activator family protein n=1 Tax=Lacticaseibacillus absianus TaxID=2729623 RepID=UPI003CCCAFBB